MKGDIYEGLLQNNAEDTKSRAGQYFTPRPLIQAIAEVMSPQPMQTICDPACGTGGFFLAAHGYLSARSDQLDRAQTRFLRYETFHGTDFMGSVVRLCVMNLHLHSTDGDESLEDTENLPEPDDLAGEIAANLAAAFEQFQDIYEA